MVACGRKEEGFSKLAHQGSMHGMVACGRKEEGFSKLAN